MKYPTIKDWRRWPTPISADVQHYALPSMSLAYMVLRELVADIQRLNDIRGELPGVGQLSRSMNWTRDFTIRVHSLIDMCLNEYAQNYYRRVQGHSLTHEDMRAFLRQSLSENGSKITAFGKLFGHPIVGNASLVEDLTLLCQVRDVLYHYEAHRYEKRDIPRILKEMAQKLHIKERPTRPSFGPLGVIDTHHYSNRVNRILGTFLNVLLTPYKHFLERDDIMKFAEENDLIFLVESLSFVHLRRVLSLLTISLMKPLDELDNVLVSRCASGYVIATVEKSVRRVFFFDMEKWHLREIQSRQEFTRIQFDDEDRLWEVIPQGNFAISDIEVTSSMMRS